MGFLTVLKEILEIVLQFIFSFFRLKNIREKSSKDSIGVDDWRKEDFEFKDLKINRETEKPKSSKHTTKQ